MPPGASDIPGLEVAGAIVSGDAQAMAQAGFKVGDRVCALVAGGGYAQLCVAPVGQCLPVPQGLTDIEAASLPETFFTVWSNVFDRVKLQPGETLLVQGGTSGIGVTAIQMAKALGSKVIATAGSDDKCEACLQARRRPRHQLPDPGLCRGSEEAHRRAGRRRDPRHGRRRLRRARGGLPGRGRPARHHRGAGRREERIQRRRGAAQAPDDHRLDAAAAAGGVQGGDRASRCATRSGRCWPAAPSSR